MRNFLKFIKDNGLIGPAFAVGISIVGFIAVPIIIIYGAAGRAEGIARAQAQCQAFAAYRYVIRDIRIQYPSDQGSSGYEVLVERLPTRQRFLLESPFDDWAMIAPGDQVTFRLDPDFYADGQDQNWLLGHNLIPKRVD